MASSSSTQSLTRRLGRLSLTSTSTSVAAPCRASTQTRSFLTNRRARKGLNIPPAPSISGLPATQRTTGGSGASRLGRVRSQHPHDDHIIFNPPAAMPNVYHTPVKFLPRDDIRRQYALRQQQQQQQRRSASTAGAPSPGSPIEVVAAALPPNVSSTQPKRYHVTAEQVQEIRRLRKEDDNKWTVAVLARKFDCSKFFVSQVSQASEQRLAALEKERKEATKFWGPRRRAARKDRQRRRELWERDE